MLPIDHRDVTRLLCGAAVVLQLNFLAPGSWSSRKVTTEADGQLYQLSADLKCFESKGQWTQHLRPAERRFKKKKKKI